MLKKLISLLMISAGVLIAPAIANAAPALSGAPIYTPPALLPWGAPAQPQPARKVAAPSAAQVAINKSAPKGLPKVAGHSSASLAAKSGVNTYFYNTAQQYPAANTIGVASSGVSAIPALSGANHSLGEIAVMKDDTNQNLAEIGWNVDPGVNGDSSVHLFCYWWKNGKGQGYNGGTGFVPWSSPSATCGQNISSTVGTTVRYGIVHDGSAWWLAYNNGWVGYYPDTLWSSTAYGTPPSNSPAVTWNTIGYYQVFGEIAYNGPSTQPAATACADMGNGALGTSTSPLPARWASTQTEVGTTWSNAALTTGTNAYPTYWYGYLITAMSFRYGGPGAC